MIQSNKERCIAKIISVTAGKFEAELLSNIKSFNVVGFDDIYQFIQLNGYVLIVIEDYYIVASILSIRNKDVPSNYKNNTDENALNKIYSTKLLDLFPIGVLKKDNKKDNFEFGVSNYPLLYSNVLYITEEELNSLFSNKIDEKADYLDIGNWTLMEKYSVKIEINKFFGFHSAILGNTGSGKSCTISALLQSVYAKKEFPKSTFIFFDVNGEYKTAFTKDDDIDSIDNVNLKYLSFTSDQDKTEFTLPLNLLNIEEWQLLLKASEKAQAPILRNALGIYNLCNQNSNDKDKNTHEKEDIKTYLFCKITKLLLTDPDTNFIVSRVIAIFQKLKNDTLNDIQIDKCNFENRSSIECLKFNNTDFFLHFGDIQNLEKFQSYLDNKLQNIEQKNIEFNYKEKDSVNIDLKKLEEYIDLAIMWEEAHGNKQVRDYCSSMITRLKSLQNREEFEFFQKTNNETIDTIDRKQYIESLIYNNKENAKKEENNIIIIDFDNIDDEVIEVVTSILARLFFDYLKKDCKEEKERNSKPLHLVLDEAHRYISNSKGREYFFEANRIFERIAKEARKYGLFLILSSQRPSELNETVLSQCSNFIIHRIQNPNDLFFIKKMTPFISSSILDQLPSIPTQKALIFGTGVNLPVLFKVKTADPMPDSKNNNIVKNWGSAKQ